MNGQGIRLLYTYASIFFLPTQEQKPEIAISPHRRFQTFVHTDSRFTDHEIKTAKISETRIWACFVKICSLKNYQSYNIVLTPTRLHPEHKKCSLCRRVCIPLSHSTCYPQKSSIHSINQSLLPFFKLSQRFQFCCCLQCILHMINIIFSEKDMEVFQVDLQSSLGLE